MLCSGVSYWAGHLSQSGWLQRINRSALRSNRRDSHSIRYHCGLWYSEQGTSQCYAKREELYTPNTGAGERCTTAIKRAIGNVSVTHRWGFRPYCDPPYKPGRTPINCVKKKNNIFNLKQILNNSPKRWKYFWFYYQTKYFLLFLRLTSYPLLSATLSVERSRGQ